MNIFWLDLDPHKSADLACDQHIVKMITEHSQLLLSQLLYFDFGAQEMKPVPPGKLLMCWLSDEFGNFLYLYQLTREYYRVFEQRFGHNKHEGMFKLQRAVHAAGGLSQIRKAYRVRGYDSHHERISQMRLNPERYITVPPQYMTEHLKADLSTFASSDIKSQLEAIVAAYRRLYRVEKSSFARYAHSSVPPFMAP